MFFFYSQIYRKPIFMLSRVYIPTKSLNTTRTHTDHYCLMPAPKVVGSEKNL